MVDRFLNRRFRNHRNGSAVNERAYAHMARSHRASKSGSLEDHIVEFAAEGSLASAAREVICTQMSNGLPITSKRGNQVVKVYPDGHCEVLEVLKPAIYKLPEKIRLLKRK